MLLNQGRTILSIPGPSVIPDRVLLAAHRASPNIYEGELVDLVDGIHQDLKHLAQTTGDVAIYPTNGHGAWEAALRNTLVPGDKIVVMANGFFAKRWGAIAEAVGLEVLYITQSMDEWADPQRLADVLSEEKNRSVKAVLIVHAETSSSVCNDVAALRAAIDRSGHDALFMVDCIASLGCDRFEMDKWKVDVAISASQKGLMTPIGLSFVFFNGKAYASGRRANPGPFWNWEKRARSDGFYDRFHGTASAHHLFSLREALNMIVREEGIEAVWRRHKVLAEAVWAALDAWSEGGDLRMNVSNPARRATGVTTVNTAPGVGAKIRRWCEAEAGVTLGNSLGFPAEEVGDHFRIGHMGHLNLHMILGVLSCMEAAMVAQGISHGDGAINAAANAVADNLRALNTIPVC
ncbi:pyridoxal-phosphate-dependent aminotransferase family protein (plasmid) [Agrobacterium sp. rho-13.3]|uniref:pyridoxal-phosphate-dependent aminotransferase family protein n=1 Tax=Agrobacterium sp. rho-13.3 TaxID=3072980 RepID=UPI002A0B11DA|nr:aminotransferase class V-fold PLP-dependent enzyme [Agrobacterium sp. rho-13.3]MDX8310223.1 aminotransferase class V-fold PLP-dependent enzyme [Agrobacterium sp. rho-13.3]